MMCLERPPRQPSTYKKNTRGNSTAMGAFFTPISTTPTHAASRASAWSPIRPYSFFVFVFNFGGKDRQKNGTMMLKK